MSQANYADPVSHHIQDVYVEYLKKWSYGQDRNVLHQNVEDLGEPDKSPGSPTRNAAFQIVATSPPPRKDTESLVKVPTKPDTKTSAVKAIPEQASNNERASISHQNGTTTFVDQSFFGTNGPIKPKTSEDPKQGVVDRGSVGAKEQRTESTPSSTPRTEARRPTHRRDMIPSQPEKRIATTRVNLPKEQPSRPQSKRIAPERRSSQHQSTHIQQTKQQQRESRLRDRQHKESEAQSIHDESTRQSRRPARRPQSKQRGLSTAQPSESEEEIVRRSRRALPPLPKSVILRPTEFVRRNPEDLADLTLSPTLTSTTSRKSTAPLTSPRTDLDDEEARARLQRKAEREATELAIVEQQVAKLRAQEANVKKCYYCWHYSQPCNPNSKPKCNPCRKNRRSCFGGFSRTEFCAAYMERTGKVHKLTAKDNITPRSALKRKGSHTSSSHRGVLPHKRRRPQRFFLQDDVLKCYRCWDRSLLCDHATPKCGSCVKGRAACFGFKASRQEFCEMFEEETGKKHKWADSAGGGQNEASNRVSPSRRRARRPIDDDDDDETSELSEEEDRWNSETDGSDGDESSGNGSDDDDDISDER